MLKIFLINSEGREYKLIFLVLIIYTIISFIYQHQNHRHHDLIMPMLSYKELRVKHRRIKIGSYLLLLDLRNKDRYWTIYIFRSFFSTHYIESDNDTYAKRYNISSYLRKYVITRFFWYCERRIIDEWWQHWLDWKLLVNDIKWILIFNKTYIL